MKGKSLKNLSDCPLLGRYVTLLGKLAEFITHHMVYFLNVNMFSDTMSEFYYNCSVYMCLNHPIRTGYEVSLILFDRLHNHVCNVFYSHA